MQLTTQEILTLELNELYNCLQILETEHDFTNDDKIIINNIKNGIELKFPLTLITGKKYEEYTYKGKPKICIHGIGSLNYTDWREEIDKRTTLMRILINDTLNKNKIFEGR